jgi:Tol biopolymer transport system component
MKKFLMLSMILGICSTGLIAQDRFPVTQLTSDPAQEGFPTWSPDGRYLIYQHSDRQDSLGYNGLWRMLSNGSGAKQIFHELAEHPRWSPDGSLVVFDADTGNSIKMIPAEGGEPILFLPDSIHIENGGLACWSPDGTRIAFLEGSGLSVCVYDAKKGEISSIFRKEGFLPLPGGWTPDGKEKNQITGHHENFYRYLALTPDGSLLVYGVVENRQVGLYIMPAEGGPSLPLVVSEGGHNDGPSWSPDGNRLAFTSTRSGSFDIWVMDVDVEQLKKDLQADLRHP